MWRALVPVLMLLALAACGSQDDGAGNSLPLLATEAKASQVANFGPRTNFALHCQGCHLPDGSGFAGRVPDMRGELSAMVRLPEGRRYLVQVPGSANSTLTNRETADLLNWLIVEMGPHPVAPFRPYTETEVAGLRAVKIDDAMAMRARVIAQLPPTRTRPESVLADVEPAVGIDGRAGH